MMKVDLACLGGGDVIMGEHFSDFSCVIQNSCFLNLSLIHHWELLPAHCINTESIFAVNLLHDLYITSVIITDCIFVCNF